MHEFLCEFLLNDAEDGPDDGPDDNAKDGAEDGVEDGADGDVDDGADDSADGDDGCHLSRGLLGLCCFVEAGFSPSPPPWEGGATNLPPWEGAGFATKIHGRWELWSAIYMPSSKGLSANRVKA